MAVLSASNLRWGCPFFSIHLIKDKSVVIEGMSQPFPETLIRITAAAFRAHTSQFKCPPIQLSRIEIDDPLTDNVVRPGED